MRTTGTRISPLKEALITGNQIVSGTCTVHVERVTCTVVVMYMCLLWEYVDTPYFISCIIDYTMSIYYMFTTV